ncbi:PH domain-containing protein [Paradevosia shaoguanensis]|uniref:PH domain-containing protein n=1 Tax=Paradevosia shaoguanensis TaxID=1335043 RepID=UPI00193227A2|nr:PH domain-containing protein [Paradevosia shaoguanensis]
MSYVDSILQPNERVLNVGHMHWIVYLRGLGVAAIGLVVILLPLEGGLLTGARLIGAVLFILGVVALFRAWLAKVTTEIAVTNYRVVKKRGLIWRETAEMNMEKVESVLVDQSLLGRMFGFGSVVIRGTGSGIEGLHFIANPLALRNAIVVR